MIHFDIKALQKKVSELEAQTNIQGFWDDIKHSTAVLSELKQIQNKINKYNQIKENLQNLKELNALLLFEEDLSLVKELLKDTNNLAKEIDILEVETLFAGKYDKNNAILSIHPGARRYRISRLVRNVI